MVPDTLEIGNATGQRVTVLETAAARGHEQVLLCQEDEASYRGIIAIHDTTLGPAFGGTRCLQYADDESALVDALRLSRGMTYKNAVAGLPFGGGKSVVFADSGGATRREAFFRAHGRFVEGLGGGYITAEDVGTTARDMEYIRRETRHVTGLLGGSGDPSPSTARGVLRGMQAAAQRRWGQDSLEGKTVAIQGCGAVGSALARLLREAGARLVVADRDLERARPVVRDTGARLVEPDAIYDVRADVFAPCALGAVLNDDTIARLEVEIVAGSANNQLLDERHGRLLRERGMLYAPDFVANAGGVIHCALDLLGWDASRVAQKIDAIYDTMLSIFDQADREGIPTSAAADRFAEARLQAGGVLTP